MPGRRQLAVHPYARLEVGARRRQVGIHAHLQDRTRVAQLFRNAELHDRARADGPTAPADGRQPAITGAVGGRVGRGEIDTGIRPLRGRRRGDLESAAQVERSTPRCAVCPGDQVPVVRGRDRKPGQARHVGDVRTRAVVSQPIHREQLAWSFAVAGSGDAEDAGIAARGQRGGLLVAVHDDQLGIVDEEIQRLAAVHAHGGPALQRHSQFAPAHVEIAILRAANQRVLLAQFEFVLARPQCLAQHGIGHRIVHQSATGSARRTAVTTCHERPFRHSHPSIPAHTTSITPNTAMPPPIMTGKASSPAPRLAGFKCAKKRALNVSLQVVRRGLTQHQERPREVGDQCDVIDMMCSSRQRTASTSSPHHANTNTRS